MSIARITWTFWHENRVKIFRSTGCPLNVSLCGIETTGVRGESNTVYGGAPTCDRGGDTRARNPEAPSTPRAPWTDPGMTERAQHPRRECPPSPAKNTVEISDPRRSAGAEMCLGRAGGSGGAFARSESIGSGWRTFGHWSNNSSWYPAAARRPPQSDMWKRVPQTPHCLARSEFPRESEPPHLWHVPRAASFPIKSGPGIVTSGLPGREVGPNICPTPFLRPVNVTARLAKCALVGASRPCPTSLTGISWYF